MPTKVVCSNTTCKICIINIFIVDLPCFEDKLNFVRHISIKVPFMDLKINEKFSTGTEMF